MRPMFMEFPNDIDCFAIDNQWMIGGSLLVKPITSEGTITTTIYLPTGSGPWYDLIDGSRISSKSTSSSSETVTVSAPLEKIPVLIKGGKISDAGAKPSSIAKSAPPPGPGEYSPKIPHNVINNPIYNFVK